MLDNPFPMRYLDLAVICAYLVASPGSGARFRLRRRRSATTSWAGARRRGGAIGSRSSRRDQHAYGHRHSALSSRQPRLPASGPGYLAARVVISTLFLPQYSAARCTTAYELMQRRFGQRIRNITRARFCCSGPGRGGVRVFPSPSLFHHISEPARWRPSC